MTFLQKPILRKGWYLYGSESLVITGLVYWWVAGIPPGWSYWWAVGPAGPGGVPTIIIKYIIVKAT